MAIKFFKATFFKKNPPIVDELRKKEYSVDTVEGNFNINTKENSTVYPFTEVIVDKPVGTGAMERIIFLLKNKFFPF